MWQVPLATGSEAQDRVGRQGGWGGSFAATLAPLSLQTLHSRFWTLISKLKFMPMQNKR